MSQRKSMQSPAEVLADEFLQERAAALGRLGRALEGSLAALARFDADHSQAVSAAECRPVRASLVAEASRALWHFVVQREACGLRDLRYVLRDYRVPREVAARMGAVPRAAHAENRPIVRERGEAPPLTAAAISRHRRRHASPVSRGGCERRRIPL